MKNLFFLSLVSLSISCTRLQTINLKKHSYSTQPDSVVWIQIAGISENHLALLKNSQHQGIYRSSFENSSCFGKSWNYNLTTLRPDATIAFNSQLTGFKNAKLTCEDFSKHAIWNDFFKKGYQVNILEMGADLNSLESLKNCEEMKDTSFRFIFMKKPSELFKNVFDSYHFHDNPSIQKKVSGFFYDKTCSDDGCVSSINDNFKNIINYRQDASKRFVLIRDFRYLSAMKKNRIEEVKNLIKEYDNLLNSITENKNLLLLISSAESVSFDYPIEGKEWRELDLKGIGLTNKSIQLNSPVWAFGPMSENFCGFYEDSEIKNRLLYFPTERIFDWKAISPFN